jgi:crotonobetainyl-CoA:carnitine CoA-transferase CaiB-like acyl-CoA transferase
MRDPHYAARGNIVSVPDPDLGTLRMQAVIPRFARTPGHIREAGGPLGADNEAIYQRELGLTVQECERLRAREVI